MRKAVLVVFFLLFFSFACAFDYNKEAKSFDERIENLSFIMGASRQAVDEDDELSDLTESIEELRALKQDYREMTQAMSEKDVNTAIEKRELISLQILSITQEQGLEYESRDIDKIVGSWSGFEIGKIKKSLEAEKYLETKPIDREPTPKKTNPTIPTPPPRTTTVEEEEEKAPLNSYLIFGVLGVFILLIGLYKYYKKKRYYNYCLIFLLAIILMQFVQAGCVGMQCGDITSAKVWTMESVTLENGAILPANTLICESDTSTGNWNSKCNAYCDDPECTGEGITEEFKFKVEMSVKNTSDGTEANYNTLIDGEGLYFMHGCGGISVKLSPGEEKTFTKDTCVFRYNEHMDPNYPSLNGWFTPRGTCGRSLYCFKSDHHFTCKSQMFKIASQDNWAFVTYDPIAGNDGQRVKGSIGLKVVSPDPDLYPGDIVYVDIGEDVELEAAMKNFGPKEVCVKAALSPYPNWLDNLNPIQGYHLPNYNIDWEYFPLAKNESKTKSTTFQPVIPGLWRIDWRHYQYYEKDPVTGNCGPNPTDRWGNAVSWHPYTSHTVQVNGPDAYLHGMYPPVFYFPPEEGKLGVETHLTVTSAYGTEAFTNPDFPLLADIYYFDSGYLKAHKVSSLDLAANKSMADLPVLQEFETDKILGVDQIIAILKYDPSKDIPGVTNDALMNEWMAKTGHQGSGSWCGEKCEYGYGVYRIPVDFVKFIDLNEILGDYYYFDEVEGFYYMEMNPSGYPIVSVYDGNPTTATQTSTASIPAATSSEFTVSTDYWIKIVAPAGGIYDINIEATPEGKTITDRVRIRLKVLTPPEADFLAVPNEGFTPLIVDFQDNSKDDGQIIQWRWDFGEGPIMEGNTPEFQSPSFTYSNEGPFNATLTVWDDDLMSDSVTKEVKTYSTANVIQAYGFERVADENGWLGAICNKNLPGTLMVTDADGHEIYSADYTCNEGAREPGPLKVGIHLVSFKFKENIDCEVCKKSVNFVVLNEAQEIGIPENGFLQAIIAFGIISLVLVVKTKTGHQ